MEIQHCIVFRHRMHRITRTHLHTELRIYFMHRWIWRPKDKFDSCLCILHYCSASMRLTSYTSFRYHFYLTSFWKSIKVSNFHDFHSATNEIDFCNKWNCLCPHWLITLFSTDIPPTKHSGITISIEKFSRLFSI